MKESQPDPEASYVPTRLIDVGGKDGREEPRLVISETYPPLNNDESHPDSRRYIALSYCWGPPEAAACQLKTTRDSLADRLRGIKLETLPKTLLDAVLVCRALGVRYLWIDALCIIQGDKEDWEKESYQMENVYSNSLLTICAGQGDSCLSGFLERQPLPQIDISFTSSLNPSISGTFAIFQAPGMNNIKDDLSFLNMWPKDPPIMVPFSTLKPGYNPFDADIGDSNWNTRGWTFQEATLSPRLLLFGVRMVHLYVNNARVSEDESCDEHDIQWGYSLRKTYDTAEEAFSDWVVLVRTYSSRALSHRSDTLPAMSALSKRFAAKTHDEFLAGLWRSSLHRGLMWGHFGVPTPATFLDSAAEYTAPSWSWACQPNLVGWVWEINVTSKPEFQLQAADMAVGLNPFGHVKTDQLLLQAKVCKLPPSVQLRRTSVYMGLFFPYEMHVLDSEGGYIAHLLFDWRHPSVQAPIDPETGEEKEDGPVDQLSMMLVSSRPYNDAEMMGREVDDPEIILGLLVLPTGNSDEYKRGGLFLSESRDLGGRRFWDQIQAHQIRLV